MATNEEVLGPLIKFALENNRPAAEEHLKTVGKRCCELLPDKCRTLDQGIEQAKRNLDYFVQYYEPHNAMKVKEFYGLRPVIVKLDPGLEKDRCTTVVLDSNGVIDVFEANPAKSGSIGRREQS